MQRLDKPVMLETWGERLYAIVGFDEDGLPLLKTVRSVKELKEKAVKWKDVPAKGCIQIYEDWGEFVVVKLTEKGIDLMVQKMIN